MGALPTLYAATQDIPGDSYVGPDGFQEQRGHPKLVGRSGAAQDTATAREAVDALGGAHGRDVPAHAGAPPETIHGVTDTAWEELEEAVAGEVVRPGAAAYDRSGGPRSRASTTSARRRSSAAQSAAGRRGGARLRPRGAAAVAVRSGGHCFAGRSTSEGVVIDVSPMDSVDVAEGERATIGAGARLGDVYDALDAHGLHDPRRLRPDRRDRRPDARRRARDPRPPARADLGQPARRAGRARRRPGRRRDERGPPVGAARRRRRALRRRHLARVRDDPGAAAQPPSSWRGRPATPRALIAAWQGGRPPRRTRSPRACC